jgi:hypothetical protein
MTVTGRVRTDQEIVQDALTKYAQTSGAPSRGDALTALGRLVEALHTAIQEREEAHRGYLAEIDAISARYEARLERVGAAARHLNALVEQTRLWEPRTEPHIDAARAIPAASEALAAALAAGAVDE